jgi:hypothetical protein
VVARSVDVAYSVGAPDPAARSTPCVLVLGAAEPRCFPDARSAPAYEEASRRALTTAPKVNTVAANMKTARETERGAPDRLIKTQRIVPPRKPNQIPNNSSERRSVMSTLLNDRREENPRISSILTIGMAGVGPQWAVYARGTLVSRIEAACMTAKSDWRHASSFPKNLE